jgi:hypothetical protein
VILEEDYFIQIRGGEVEELQTLDSTVSEDDFDDFVATVGDQGVMNRGSLAHYKYQL